VVVAIIALLIAILLPALKDARERARTVACATNIKTSSMAVLYYTEANQDTFPGCGEWSERVSVYLQKVSVGRKFAVSEIPRPFGNGIDQIVEFYRCPSDRQLAATSEVRRRVGDTFVRTNYLVSYCFNGMISLPLVDPEGARRGTDYRIQYNAPNASTDPNGNLHYKRLVKRSEVTRPSEVVTLADAGDDDISAGVAKPWGERMVWDFDDAEDNFPSPEDPGQLEVHHVRGNNFSFVDMHVEYRPVLSSNIPQRGVPRFPWAWVPLNNLQPAKN